MREERNGKKIVVRQKYWNLGGLREGFINKEKEHWRFPTLSPQC